MSAQLQAGLFFGAICVAFGPGMIWHSHYSRDRMNETVRHGEKARVVVLAGGRTSDSRRVPNNKSRFYVTARRTDGPVSDSPQLLPVSKRFFRSISIGETYDLLIPPRPRGPYVFAADTDRQTYKKEELIFGWVVTGIGVVIGAGVFITARGRRERRS